MKLIYLGESNKNKIVFESIFLYTTYIYIKQFNIYYIRDSVRGGKTKKYCVRHSQCFLVSYNTSGAFKLYFVKLS